MKDETKVEVENAVVEAEPQIELTPEEQAFEDELAVFKDRLASSSLLNIIKTQFKKML